MNEPPAIACRGVGVRRGERTILEGVDWTVPAGSVAAVLGPNGSGKSTLARVISGYVWASEGSVSVLGGAFGDIVMHELRKDLRLVQPQGEFSPDPEMTARQVVQSGAFGTLGLYDPVSDELAAEADARLAEVGLGHVGRQIFQTLSSGERVRCQLARAMMGHPKLLLLDEPTAGLDLLAREQVLATVEAIARRPVSDGKPRATIVLITHHLEELPPSVSQILLLSEGKVAASGTPEEVLRDEILGPAYGCPLHVDRHDGRFYARVSPKVWDGLINA